MSWYSHSYFDGLTNVLMVWQKRGRKWKMLKMNDGNRSNMNNKTMHAYICWKWMSSSPIELLSLKGKWMSIEWFWMPIMDMIWLWTWIELNYMRSALIAKQRGSNTLYVLQIDVLHLQTSYAFKVHHPYIEKFSHYQKGEIVDSMPRFWW